MIRLIDYILEELSKENIEKLEEYVNDNNVNEVIKILDKHFNASLTEDDFKKFNKILNDEKHFDALSWPRKSSATEYFSKLFDEKLDIFKEIIEHKGTISINDLPEHGNIFNYCKGFIDEAKTIATLSFPLHNTSSGKFEILLKLILKEGFTGSKGDVSLTNSEGGMEVKCHSKIKGNSGGRPFGQGKHYGSTGKIIEWLVKNNLIDNSISYLNLLGIKKFLQHVKNKDINVIIENLVNSIMYQYNLITIDKKLSSDISENNYKKILSSSKEFIGNNINDAQKIGYLIECVQLCCYSIIEKFDYFIMPYINLNEPESDELLDSGKYLLIKNCQDFNESKLYDFNYLNEYIKFSYVGDSDDTRKKAGEMYLKISKIKN